MTAEAALVALSEPETGPAPAEVQLAVFSADSRHAQMIAREQDGNCIVFDDLQKAMEHLMETEDEHTALVADLTGHPGAGIEEIAERAASLVPTVIICDVAGKDRIPQALLDTAFFVLRAPVSKATMKCVIAAAKEKAAQAQRMGRHYQQLLESLKQAETGKFLFRTIREAETLARFLAYAFPDRARAARGLGELMRNAVEHGNLEIGFKEKARLLEDGMLGAEIERRLANAAYQDRVAEAVLARKPEGVYVVIADKGPGFDWSDFTKFTPARAAYKNGRGIQLARLTCFDKLAYNEAGNQVTVFSAVE